MIHERLPYALDDGTLAAPMRSEIMKAMVAAAMAEDACSLQVLEGKANIMADQLQDQSSATSSDEDRSRKDKPVSLMHGDIGR